MIDEDALKRRLKELEACYDRLNIIVVMATVGFGVVLLGLLYLVGQHLDAEDIHVHEAQGETE